MHYLKVHDARAWIDVTIEGWIETALKGYPV
jgi:hypothetical protein